VLYQHYGHWQFDRGDERFRRLVARLDGWGAEVVATVRRGGGDESWDPLCAATELLAFSARVLDLPGAHSQLNADLINALLTDAPSGVNRRGSAWDKLVDACSSDHRRKVRDSLLSRVGARQGTGRPQAIDVTAILPAITGFKRTWTLSPPPDHAPNEFKRLFNDIESRLQEAIDDELRRLKEWHELVVQNLDPAAAPAEIADFVAKAAQAALEAGVFEPARLRHDFDDTTKAFRRTRYSVIDEVGSLALSSTDQQPGKLLSDLAVDRSRPMQEIERFVNQAVAIVDGSCARATQQAETLRAGGGGGDELNALRTSLAELESALRGVTT
jgi:hypothetical protein